MDDETELPMTWELFSQEPYETIPDELLDDSSQFSPTSELHDPTFFTQMSQDWEEQGSQLFNIPDEVENQITNNSPQVVLLVGLPGYYTTNRCKVRSNHSHKKRSCSKLRPIYELSVEQGQPPHIVDYMCKKCFDDKFITTSEPITVCTYRKDEGSTHDDF